MKTIPRVILVQKMTMRVMNMKFMLGSILRAWLSPTPMIDKKNTLYTQMPISLLSLSAFIVTCGHNHTEYEIIKTIPRTKKKTG